MSGRTLLVALSAAFSLTVAWADYRTGTEISLSFLYLVPILAVTWAGSTPVTAVFTLGCAGLWVLDARLTHHLYAAPGVPYWNAAMLLATSLIASGLLTALKRALEREQRLSREDPITRAANSRTFEEIAQAELVRARRSGRALTLAYLDVDHFKKINDGFGHKSGDTLLQTIVQTSRESLRATDTLARIGGDEFAVLLPETSLEQAREPLVALRRALLEAVSRRGWPVTFSIGAVTFSTPPDSVDAMLAAADALMYTVKNRGRDALALEAR